MAIRKNVTSLSDTEKANYVTGVKRLKANGKYDQYVHIHDDVMMHTTPNGSNAAHSGPAFFPWHREFILRFERDLQQVLGDTNFGLPYWDWATDAALPDPTKAVIWDDRLMGGQGSPVSTGPFRAGEWTIVPSGSLVRNLALDQDARTLPSQADVDAALAVTTYDSAPWNRASNPSFRNQFEGWINGPQLHNRVHVWVGGSMLPMTSPNDPVFFLHHCNVDRIWARWQLCSSKPSYLPVSGGPQGHNLNDLMWPWDSGSDIRRPSNLLDHLALGYMYDTEISQRQTLTLRRTSGNRFVSTKVIQVTNPCNPQAGTDATLFVPGRVGGVIRAQLGSMSDEVDVIPSP